MICPYYEDNWDGTYTCELDGSICQEDGYCDITAEYDDEDDDEY